MSVLTPAQLSQLNGNGGLRASYYIVQVNGEVPVDGNGVLLDPEVHVSPKPLVNLRSVSMGYGPGGQEAMFQTWDPSSIEVVDGPDALPSGVLVRPQQGDTINVYAKIDDGEHQLVFRGDVDSVHEKRADEGILYNCHATGRANRLNEYHVTFTANLRNDPINPSPRFSASGTLVDGRLKTIAEIVREILDFPDAFGTSGYFTYDDIEWDGLETNLKCGGFIPSQVVFEDTTKGNAIESVLQRAGNFRLWYDPATDKLRVVEINLACNRCGDQWPITFATAGASGSNHYSMQLQIVDGTDQTEWSTRGSANVCRITSGPISLYSGNYTIDASSTPTDVDNDLAADQVARRIGPDGADYRFYTPNSIVQDTRERKQHFVGMPLFPGWNVHEDYLPAIYEIQSVQLPAGGVNNAFNQPIAANAIWPHGYLYAAEFESITRGHQSAMGEIHPDRTKALRVYEAWYATDTCPACAGTGSVQKVYGPIDGEDLNEPNLEVVQVGPSGAKMWKVQVTNYLFNPSQFGKPNPSGNTYGLVPFDPTDENEYPRPWRNLCPVCRGVGLQPEYRIRNIQSELFSGRANAVAAPSGTVHHEVSIDPEDTVTGPETLAASQTRIAVQQGPMVQTEEAIGGRWYLPAFTYRNYSLDSIEALPSGNRVQRFEHPLQMTVARKQLISLVGMPADNPASKLVPDSWDMIVPFTKVVAGSSTPYTIDTQGGQVIFESPVFVPSRGRYTVAYQIQGRKFKVANNGLIATHNPGGGRISVDDYTFGPTGYWRPARVWLQHFYQRQGWYERIGGAASISSITPDDTVGHYVAKAMVVDGRYCLEVAKSNPSDYGYPPAELGNDRVRQIAISDHEARIQTSEADLHTLAIPPSGEISSASFEAYKRDVAGVDFARGRALKWEGTTQGEEFLEVAGYGDADYQASVVRPRPYSFRLVDDRPRLLMRAIRELEAANNLTVNGTLDVMGVMVDHAAGLGWVDYPGRAKASVSRLTYNFGDGCVTATLELSREEARYGEMPPDDMDRMSHLERTVGDIRKLVTASTSNGSGGTTRTTGDGRVPRSNRVMGL